MSWIISVLLLFVSLSCQHPNDKGRFATKSEGSTQSNDRRYDHIPKSLVALFNRENKFQCTGVLLDEKTILTAGHCFFEDNKVLVSSSFAHSQNQRIEAQVSRNHPLLSNKKNFTVDGNISRLYLNDIQLITLKETLPENFGAQAAKLSDHNIYPGNQVLVYGYGKGIILNENPFKITRHRKILSFELPSVQAEVLGVPRVGNSGRILGNDDPYNFIHSQKMMVLNFRENSKEKKKYLNFKPCDADSVGVVFSLDGHLVGLIVAQGQKFRLSSIGEVYVEPDCLSNKAYMVHLKGYRQWIRAETQDKIALEGLILSPKKKTGQFKKRRLVNKDFQILNKTGFKLDELYFVSDYSSTWGYNLLHIERLRHKDVYRANIIDGTCHYEIRGVYQDDKNNIRTLSNRIDVCKNSSFSIE